MPLSTDLPTDKVLGEVGHAAGHNATNTRVNEACAAVNALPTSADVTSAITTHSAATDPHGDRAYTDTQISGRQPLDSDLTAVAGLTPSNDDLLQRKSGAWANRTVAQVKTDLGLAAVATSGSGDDITTGTVADARIASTIARDSEVTAAISTHTADTTAVHGIADTGVLLTSAEVQITFGDYADGTPTTTDTGQTIRHLNRGADLVVVDGLLTDTVATGAAAGYIEIDAGATVNRIGGELSWSTGTGGTAALVVWQQSVVDEDPAVPASRCHFSLSRTAWAYGIWPSLGAGGQVVLGSGALETTLAADGTKYRIEIVMDGDTAHILLPDGQVVTIVDSRISSLAGQYATWENFYTDASVESKPQWSRVWAAAGPVAAYADTVASRLALAMTNTYRAKAVTLTSTGTISTSSSTFVELSTTLRRRVVVPPSGKVNHRLAAWVTNSTSIYLWMPALYDPTSGAQLRAPAIQMTNGAFDAWTFCEYLHTGLTPGAVVEARWLHGTFGTGSGTVQDDGTGRNLTMTVTAIGE